VGGDALADGPEPRARSPENAGAQGPGGRRDKHGSKKKTNGFTVLFFFLKKNKKQKIKNKK